MRTPPTFTDRNARTMLASADAHTLAYDAQTQQYTCTLQLVAWYPPVTGSGPRLVDAVWVAMRAALALGAARRCPCCGQIRPDSLPGAPMGARGDAVT